ncbi:MAG TPA: hypothetical protein VHZ24_05840 [Pirellulales bacterium]|nr:hypothetical protein [Pirellulales bacterium]
MLPDDVESPAYRKLVDEMLATDLAAEWQRVETLDSSEKFLERHGGREKVLADAELRAAYERRREIESKFLDLMRIGFKRFNKPAPFDTGLTAEKADTTAKAPRAGEVRLQIVLPAPGAEEQWPRFRGPEGQGIARTTGLPLE